MRNWEASWNAPALRMSTKPDTLKLIGKFETHSHQNPTPGTELYNWEENHKLPASPWGWKELDHVSNIRLFQGLPAWLISVLQSWSADGTQQTLATWERTQMVIWAGSHHISFPSSVQSKWMKKTLVSSHLPGEGKSEFACPILPLSGGLPKGLVLSYLSQSTDNIWSNLATWGLVRTEMVILTESQHSLSLLLSTQWVDDSF